MTGVPLKRGTLDADRPVGGGHLKNKGELEGVLLPKTLPHQQLRVSEAGSGFSLEASEAADLDLGL